MTCVAMCLLQTMQEGTHLPLEPDVLSTQFALYIIRLCLVVTGCTSEWRAFVNKLWELIFAHLLQSQEL